MGIRLLFRSLREAASVLLLHVFRSQMSVNLRRVDGLVAEQFLDEAKVRPVLQKVRGKRMAEFVGVEFKMGPDLLLDRGQDVFETADR